MIFKFAVEANVKDQMEKQLKKHLYTSYKVYTDYRKAFGHQAFFEIPVANEKEKKELYLIVREIQAPFIMKSEEEMKENVIEIQEEVRIPQKDHDLILEPGDRIKVFQDGVLEDLDIDLTEKELETFTLQANKFGKFIDKLIISSSSIEPKFNDNEIKKNKGLLSMVFDKIEPRLIDRKVKLGNSQYLKLSFYFVAHARKSSKYDNSYFYVLVGYFDLVKRTWKFSYKDSELLD